MRVFPHFVGPPAHLWGRFRPLRPVVWPSTADRMIMGRLRARSEKSVPASSDASVVDAVGGGAFGGSDEGDDAPRHRGVRIGELLVQRGLVTDEQIDQAVAAQQGTGKRLGRMLVELGIVHERDLA